MKKQEAIIIAPEKTNLIIEYIEQILLDSIKVSGTMNFSSAKINNQRVCTLDIYVHERNFEKHLNLEISVEHSLVLCEQLLIDLLEFLPHDTIGITKYYSIKYGTGENFSGVDAVNMQGSRIKINLNQSGTEFDELITKFHNKYDEIVEKLKTGEEIPKTK